MVAFKQKRVLVQKYFDLLEKKYELFYKRGKSRNEGTHSGENAQFFVTSEKYGKSGKRMISEHRKIMES